MSNVTAVAAPWWTARPALSFAEVARAYIVNLRRQLLSPEHVKKTEEAIQRIAAHARPARLDDLSPERLSAALALVRGGRHQNFHRGAVHALFQWATFASLYFGPNPAKGVARVREKRQYHRRPITWDELRALVAASPPYRALVYVTLTLCGLRPSDARRLTWSDVSFERRLLHVRATRTKNGKARWVPIGAELAQELAAFHRFCGEPDPDALIFFDAIPLPDTFYGDLETAGVARRTAEGCLNRGALRVTCGTDLARSGAPVAVAQTVLGHADSSLTLNIYTRMKSEEGRPFIEKISSGILGANLEKSRAKVSIFCRPEKV